MEYIKDYDSDEEQDTNMQVPDKEMSPTKPCKCGSTLHKRTSHKSCPLKKKKKKKERNAKLCVNMDCERFPPDWNFEEDTEETYQADEWQKCCLCDGYFNDDGLGDILYIEEEPNNKTAYCSLCGKDNNIVQMKGTGQFLCGNACDEDEDED